MTTQITATTSTPTWNTDYEFDSENRTRWFVQVFTATPHAIESRRFYGGRSDAREAAIVAGLRMEDEI